LNGASVHWVNEKKDPDVKIDVWGTAQHRKLTGLDRPVYILPEACGQGMLIENYGPNGPLTDWQLSCLEIVSIRKVL
jgi:hypothetical protein